MILLPFFLQVYRTFGLKLQFFTLILNVQENTNANFYQKGNTVMIYTDTHLHSSFSSDSDTPMELMIKQGIRLGMKTLCFTEHYDPCYPDTPDGLDFLLDFENYKKTLFSRKSMPHKSRFYTDLNSVCSRILGRHSLTFIKNMAMILILSSIPAIS